jgi:thymidylate synthase (FAD)
MQIIEHSVQMTYPITREDWLKEARHIEQSARTCYKSEDKITEDSFIKMLKMLRDKQHGAMLEFGQAKVKVICDRGVSHEIVRHRIASYAQESTRYCNYSKDKFSREITVIRPVKC